MLDISAEEIGPSLDPIQGKYFWEKRHARKMKAEVERYIDVLPNLEWVYMGERAISIESIELLESKHVASVIEVEDYEELFLEVFGNVTY